MLLLNPRIVRFGPDTWENIAAVMIDRAAHKTVEDWGEGGPYPIFADVPEQRIRVTIIQELVREDIGFPRPGQEDTLTLFTSPGADGGRKKVSAPAVILAVQHELSLKKGALRTITLAAVSPDGETDPITLTDASDGQI